MRASIQPSPILLLAHHRLPNKRPAQDVLAIPAPQLPPKRMRAGKQYWKYFWPECEGSRAKKYHKNPCDDCSRVDHDGRDNRQPKRPCQNKIDSPDVGGNGKSIRLKSIGHLKAASSTLVVGHKVNRGCPFFIYNECLNLCNEI